MLIDENTTFIVQGITGREAVNLTKECLDYGSKVVGGVTPGRKGREVHGVASFVGMPEFRAYAAATRGLAAADASELAARHWEPASTTSPASSTSPCGRC